MSDSSPKRPQKTGPTYRFATDQDGSTEEGSKPQGYLAPFNPTDITAQQAALDMMKLTSEDVLYDLGCGDGRFLFAAFLSVKGGLNCVGVEFDRIYYERCLTTLATIPPCKDKVTFHHADVCTTDLTPATAIFVYLVPAGLKLIEEKLHSSLRNGVRIASYMFSVPGLTPVKTDSTKGGCKVHFYDSTSLPS
ncbi:hypothetical protein TrVE_jg6275 [Triparma verrucosa]|uniref:Methyltransferase domain-containing protein n=2 Tax=Triparma TaxID=722752 RepID=A0A9W7AN74_9STRA|nr:hypothetical protein TrST_g757 [Triparma strigata]GMH89796.1 hypothetical protein TrVE_jg6275 [Triparma verrucosa]